MRKLLILAVTAALALSTGLVLRPEGPRIDPQHKTWCDDIYHQNVSCPLRGQVKVPASVLAAQKAQHEAWCDTIYHRNVGCSKHGLVEVPQSVLDEEKAEHEKWCDGIGHRNVGCPQFVRVNRPSR